MVHLSIAAEFQGKGRSKVKREWHVWRSKLCGESVISCTWVITEKFKEQLRVVKARLVARGFEEDSRQFRTDSQHVVNNVFNLLKK